MRTHTAPATLEELGIPRKPFYTPAEVAAHLGVSDQHILDLIHTPAGDPRHVYAVALGPRTYRIPVGALSQLVGIVPEIRIGKRPRRIGDAVRAETARTARTPARRTR